MPLDAEQCFFFASPHSACHHQASQRVHLLQDAGPSSNDSGLEGTPEITTAPLSSLTRGQLSFRTPAAFSPSPTPDPLSSSTDQPMGFTQLSDLPRLLFRAQTMWEEGGSLGLRRAVDLLRSNEAILREGLKVLSSVKGFEPPSSEAVSVGNVFAEYIELLEIVVPRAGMFRAFLALMNALEGHAACLEFQPRPAFNSLGTGSNCNARASMSSAFQPPEPSHSAPARVSLRPPALHLGAPCSSASLLCSARDLGISSLALAYASSLFFDFGYRTRGLMLVAVAIESGRADLRAVRASTLGSSDEAQGPGAGDSSSSSPPAEEAQASDIDAEVSSMAAFVRVLLMAAVLHQKSSMIATAKGYLDEAEELARHVYAQLPGTGGTDLLAFVHEHRGWVQLQNCVYPLALRSFTEALQLLTGPDSAQARDPAASSWTASTMHVMEPLTREVPASSSEGAPFGLDLSAAPFAQRRVGMLRAEIGRVVCLCGNPASAQDFYKQGLALLASSYGSECSQLAEMGRIYYWLGESSELLGLRDLASDHYERAATLFEGVDGTRRASERVADSQAKLGSLMLSARRKRRGFDSRGLSTTDSYQEGKRLLEDAYGGYVTTLGEEHPKARQLWLSLLQLRTKSKFWCC